MKFQFHRGQSHGPVVKAEARRLHCFHDDPLTGRSRSLVFTKEIQWVRETSTKLIFQHRGVDLDPRIIEFCDSRGFMTSHTDILDQDAPRICEEYKIDASSTLELAAVMTVADTPYLAGPDFPIKASRFGGFEYVCLPVDWRSFAAALLNILPNDDTAAAEMCDAIQRGEDFGLPETEDGDWTRFYVYPSDAWTKTWSRKIWSSQMSSPSDGHEIMEREIGALFSEADAPEVSVEAHPDTRPK